MSLRGKFPVSEPLPRKLHWVDVGKRVKLDPLLEPHLDATVYRYATLAEALMLLRDGTWTFLRPAAWPDAYEKHVFKELFGDKAVFDDLPGYVKCMSLEYSSEAMWRTYSTSGGLVRLSWKLGELVEEFNRTDWSREGKVYLGAIRYLQPKAIREEVERIKASGDKVVSQRAMRVLMMKRFGFAFENEIRVCFLPMRGLKPDVWKASGFRRDKVARLLVDPYLKPWEAGQIVALFKDVLGVPFPVSQSVFDTVYAGPP